MTLPLGLWWKTAEGSEKERIGVVGIDKKAKVAGSAVLR